MAFQITAQLAIQGPSNLRPIVSQIQKELQGIKVVVDVQIPRGTSQSVAGVSKNLSQLNDILRVTQAESLKTASAINNLGNAFSKLQSGSQTSASNLNKVVDSANKVNDGVSKSSNSINTFGDRIELAGKRFIAFTLAAGLIGKVVSGLQAGIGEALKFEREMIRLAQVSTEPVAALQGIQDEITRLSTSLGVASSDLLKVAQVFKQAGLSINDTKTALEAIAQAALAPTFRDINQVAEGSVAIFSQFKIRADELRTALGAINAVSAEFAVESDDIITAIQKTGGAFQVAGGNLNELIALFTSVRATTRESADTIATAFRTIFGRLQRPQIVDELRAVGVQLRFTREEALSLGQANLADQFVGPFEAIRRISQALKEIPTTDPRFAQIVESIGGIRQLSKVIPLITEFSTSQRALNVALAGGESLTRSAAQAQGSLLVQVTKVKEEFFALFRSIISSPGFQFLARQTLQLASALIALADALKPLIPLLGALALVKVGATIASGIGSLTGLRQPIKRAAGGLVPGVGSTDSVPAMLTPGEFVLRKSAVRSLGSAKLNSLNRFQEGGIVPARKGFANLQLGETIGQVVLRGNPSVSKSVISASQEKRSAGLIDSKFGPGSATRVNLGANIQTFAVPAEGSNVLRQFSEGAQKQAISSIEDSVNDIIPGKFKAGTNLRNTLSGFIFEGILSNFTKVAAPDNTERLDFVNVGKGTIGKLSSALEEQPFATRNFDAKLSARKPSEILRKGIGSGLFDQLIQANTTQLGKVLSQRTSGVQARSGIARREFKQQFQDGGLARLSKFLQQKQSFGSTFKDTPNTISNPSVESFVRTSGPFNRPLFGTERATKEQARSIGELSALSRKSKLPVDLTLFRGPRSDELADIRNQLGSDILSSSNIGKTFSRAGFTSASTSPLTAKGFATSDVLFKILTKAGSTGLPVTGAKTSENEVILPPASKFKVIGIKGNEVQLQKLVAGGSIGGSVSDKVPALLTPGEFVINKPSASKIGPGRLNQLNKGKLPGFASGGLIPGFVNGGEIPTEISPVVRELGASLNLLIKEIVSAKNALREQNRKIIEQAGRPLGPIPQPTKALPLGNISTEISQAIKLGTSEVINDLKVIQNTPVDQLRGVNKLRAEVQPSVGILPAQPDRRDFTVQNIADAAQKEADARNKLVFLLKSEAQEKLELEAQLKQEKVVRQKANKRTAAISAVPVEDDLPRLEPIQATNRRVARETSENVLIRDRQRQQNLEQTRGVSIEGRGGEARRITTAVNRRNTELEVSRQRSADSDIGLQTNRTLLQRATGLLFIDVGKIFESARQSVTTAGAVVVAKSKEVVGSFSTFLDKVNLNRQLARAGTPEQKQAIQDKIDRRAQRLQTAGIAGSLALPLLQGQLEKATGQATVTSGAGFTAGKTAAGGLGGAGIGAAVAASLGAGPVGIALAALGVGVVLATNAFLDAGNEIREAKVGEALKQITNTIEGIKFSNLGVSLDQLGTSLNEVRSNVSRDLLQVFSDLAGSSLSTPASAINVGFGLDERNQRIIQQQQRSQLQAAAPALASGLGKAAESIGKSEALLKQNFENENQARDAILTSLRKTSPAFDRIVGDLAVATGRSIADTEKQIAAVGIEARKQELSQRGRKQADLISTKTLNAIGAFTTAIEAAARAGQQFQGQLDTIANIGLGDFSQPLPQRQFAAEAGTFGFPGSAEFNKVVTDLLGPFGELGASTGNVLKSFDQITTVLPAVLSDSVKNLTDVEGTGQVVGKLLREQFGGKLSPGLEAAINLITTKIGGLDLGDLKDKIGNDVSGLSKQLIQDAIGPLKDEFQKLAQAVDNENQRVASTLAKFRQIQQQLGAAIDAVVDAETERARVIAEVESNRTGRNVFDIFTKEQANRPFEQRQQRLLTGTGLTSDDAEGIGIALRKVNQTIIEEQKRLESSGVSATNLQKELSPLITQSQNLRQALQNLTETSKRSADIQARLNVLKAEEQSRVSIVRGLTTGSPEQRQELARGISLAGQFRGLDQRGRQEFAQGLGQQDLERLFSAAGSLKNVRGFENLETELAKALGPELFAGIGEEIQAAENDLIGVQKANVEATKQLKLITENAANTFKDVMEKSFVTSAENLRKQIENLEKTLLINNKAQLETRKVDLEKATPVFDVVGRSAGGEARVKELQQNIKPLQDLSSALQRQKLLSEDKVFQSPARLESIGGKGTFTESFIRQLFEPGLGKELVDSFIKDFLAPLNAQAGQVDVTNQAGRAQVTKLLQESFTTFIGREKTKSGQEVERAEAELSKTITLQPKEREALSTPEFIKQLQAVDLSKLQIGAEGFDEAAKRIGEAVTILENKIKSFPTAQPGEKAEGQQMGGPIFSPSGTDTVPAMLTPGEFVVNRAATRSNLPLLKAINSQKLRRGGFVKYLQEGGQVLSTISSDLQAPFDQQEIAKFINDIAQLEFSPFSNIPGTDERGVAFYSLGVSQNKVTLLHSVLDSIRAPGDILTQNISARETGVVDPIGEISQVFKKANEIFARLNKPGEAAFTGPELPRAEGQRSPELIQSLEFPGVQPFNLKQRSEFVDKMVASGLYNQVVNVRSPVSGLFDNAKFGFNIGKDKVTLNKSLFGLAPPTSDSIFFDEVTAELAESSVEINTILEELPKRRATAIKDAQNEIAQSQAALGKNRLDQTRDLQVAQLASSASRLSDFQRQQFAGSFTERTLAFRERESNILAQLGQQRKELRGFQGLFPGEKTVPEQIGERVAPKGRGITRPAGVQDLINRRNAEIARIQEFNRTNRGPGGFTVIGRGRTSVTVPGGPTGGIDNTNITPVDKPGRNFVGPDGKVVAPAGSVQDFIKERDEEASKTESDIQKFKRLQREDEARRAKVAAPPDLKEGDSQKFFRLKREREEEIKQEKLREFEQRKIRNPRVNRQFGGEIPAMVTPGEFIVNKNATQSNFPLLNRINSFRNGGVVGLQGGGNVSQGSPGVTLPDFTQLNTSITLFNTAASNLSQSLLSFSTSSERLSQAMSAFPHQIELRGTHQVEVVINGADVLSRLEPSIKSLVENEVVSKLTQFNENNLGGAAGQVFRSS